VLATLRMNDPDERRRGTCLLVSFAVAAAFTAAVWDRLSLPFSTSEARFVHEALLASGQGATPEFDRPDNPVPAKVLAVIQQLVGTSERSLRLVFLLLLAASAWLLAELLPYPSVSGSAVLVLGFLAYTLGDPGVVLPAFVPLLPAALGLLAAPVGPPTSKLRAGLGIAGMVALGAISQRAGAAGAAALLAAALVRGSLVERLFALVAAACGVATGLALRPSQTVTGAFGWADAGAPARSNDWMWGPLAVLGLIVLWSFFVDRDHLRGRLAVLAAAIAAVAFGVYSLTGLQQLIGRAGAPAPPISDFTDMALAVNSTRSVGVLLIASAAAALPAIGRMLALVAIAAVLAFAFVRPPEPNRAPLELLDEARMVAQPSAGLALGGEHRVAAAVYARLGRSPSMQMFWVPETAPLETLADTCRKHEVRQLWIHPAPAPVPPGFSAAESRPSGVRKLTLLVVEGS
jgi:hypothetical protein